MSVSSLFLLSRLSSHRHVQQREHCFPQPSLVITQQHSSSQTHLNKTPPKEKRTFQRLPSHHEPQRGEAAALAAPQSRAREADVQRRWSGNHRADCACPQTASPHRTAAPNARHFQVQQDATWPGAAAHVQVDAMPRLAREALCDVWHLGVEDGCVAQRQRTTCSVPCGAECGNDIRRVVVAEYAFFGAQEDCFLLSRFLFALFPLATLLLLVLCS